MTGENRGRGRPRKTESTYADTRNDLIRSGLELLTQNGFLATGVDAIVKNANVPKGSFYYYICRSTASLDHNPDSINELQAIVLKPCPQTSTFVSYPITRKALFTVFSLIGLRGS